MVKTWTYDYYLASYRNTLRDPSLSPCRAVALGDHFHGTYAYEKSVTRHYAGKFRSAALQSRGFVTTTRRGRAIENEKKKKRLFPLHPLSGRNAFLSSV
ncbi:hypothetical protein ALC53_11488 [Atta colombica]|uniref:Uncharacterized protein n=1 Tax=Atta colombica TaxID=520822 RepID=A0A195B0N4_9HYME|nr:hypothetical protein ALC53_11488 [Atta colombica]